MKYIEKHKIFIYFSVLLSISLPVSILIQVYLFDIGHDFIVYCDAASAFVSNLDPYYVSNLEHSSLPFVYPPITLPIFSTICALGYILPIKIVYVLYYSGLLLFTYLVIKSGGGSSSSRTQTLFLITLLVSGYIGAFWNFSTGNIGILGGAALAILYYAIENDKEWLGILSISLVSIFKIFPALFAIVHSISSKSSGKAIKLLTAYSIIGGLSIGLSYVLFPDLMYSYYLAITGQLPQHSPVDEGGGASTPALLFLFIGFGDFIFGSENLGILIYLVILSLLAVSLVKIYRQRHINRIEVLSFAVIGILLFMPRVKPYSFSYAVIPTYYLVKDWNLDGKALILAITVVLPSFGRALQLGLPAIYDEGIPFFLKFINYTQSISLTLTFIMCYVIYLNWGTRLLPEGLIQHEDYK